MLAGAPRTPARDAFALFSDPYRTAAFALYVRKGDATVQRSTSLQALLDTGFRLGVREQYAYGETVDALQEDPRYAELFIGSTLGTQSYQRLLDLEIDGFLEDPALRAPLHPQEGAAGGDRHASAADLQRRRRADVQQDERGSGRRRARQPVARRGEGGQRLAQHRREVHELTGDPMAGYSGTPLIKKLGIRPGDSVVLIDAPADYDELIGPLPDRVRVRSRLARGHALHPPLRQGSRHAGPRAAAREARARAGRDALDLVAEEGVRRRDGLTEGGVREAGLAAGLVDVKICAVDETWSGLKFVYRLADRRTK